MAEGPVESQLPSTSSPVHYVDTALSLIQRHAMNGDRLDWAQVRADAAERCRGANSLRDTYPIIESVVDGLGDGHSFFSPPERGSRAIESGSYSDEVTMPSGRLLGDDVALLTVPAFRGTADQVTSYAVSLRRSIDDMGRRGVRGWVVDISGNSGGNMLPMLVGLGPLVGAGVIGAFDFSADTRTEWTYDGKGGLWLADECVLQVPALTTERRFGDEPVAVVMGAATASSGEAVAVAFSGRPRSRSFGQPTRGQSTCNETFDLADGATLALTVATFCDRRGSTFGGVLTPDVVVTGLASVAVSTAVAWLRSGRPL